MPYWVDYGMLNGAFIQSRNTWGEATMFMSLSREETAAHPSTPNPNPPTHPVGGVFMGKGIFSR